MIYVKFDSNEAVVDVTTDYHRVHNDEEGGRWEHRHDWKTMGDAEWVANCVSGFTGETYIAVDNGSNVSPRFDVTEIPKVGDAVSFAFNGDYYPDGHVVKISKTLKVIETSSGKRYYRVKQTGCWKHNRMWSLVKGHIDQRNPSF